MFVSPFLLILILSIVLIECVFLGKYISVTQEIFVNRIYISIVLGSILYMFSSTVVLIPFYFYKVNFLYITTIIIIKDAFIFTFLFARKNVFKGWKVNWKEVLIMLVFVVSISLVLHFAYDFDSFKISPYSNSLFITNYQTSINQLSLTNSSSHNFTYYFLIPFSLIFSFSSVMSLFSLFSRSNNWVNSFFSAVITLFIVFLFADKVSITNIIFASIMIFLFFNGYYLIVYARRRYGIVFGLTTLVSWSILESGYFIVLAIFIAIISIYAAMGRPRISFFTLQIASPFLILASLKLQYFSTIGAIILFVFVSLMYISIFYFGKYHFIDKVGIFAKMNIIIPTVMALGLLSWGIIAIINGNYLSESFWLEDKGLFHSFGNKYLGIIFNSIYYISLFMLVSYIGYIYIKKKKLARENIMIAIMLAMYVFMFNPFVQAIFYSQKNEEIFRHARSIAYIPLIIYSTVFATNKFNFSKIKQSIF